MKKRIGEYTRLVRNPWIQSVAMVRSSLWLGEEELLAVKNHGYVEHYQRIRYADIQALVIRKTSRRLIFGIVFGLPGFGSLFGALTGAEAWRIFWAVFAVLFLLPFAINLFKGVGARAIVKTAVGQHRLPAITRLRRAEEAAERLSLKVHEKQGELTEADLAEREVSDGGNVAGGGGQPAGQPYAPPPLPMVGGYGRQLAIFLLITLQAFLISVRFFVDSVGLDIAIFLPAPVAFILGCMELPKWKRLPSAMVAWLLAALVYLGVLGASVYFSASIMFELDLGSGRLRPVETFIAVLHAGFIAAAAVIGLGGFLSAWSFSRARSGGGPGAGAAAREVEREPNESKSTGPGP